jgi:hypothetical protein
MRRLGETDRGAAKMFVRSPTSLRLFRRVLLQTMPSKRFRPAMIPEHG